MQTARKKNTKQLQSIIAMEVLSDYQSGALTNGSYMVRRTLADIIDDRFAGHKSGLARVANDLRKHIDLQIGDDPVRLADFRLKVAEDLFRGDLAYAMGDLDTTNANDARDIVALYTELIRS
jgi:aminopeptidase N